MENMEENVSALENTRQLMRELVVAEKMGQSGLGEGCEVLSSLIVDRDYLAVRVFNDID